MEKHNPKKWFHFYFFFSPFDCTFLASVVSRTYPSVPGIRRWVWVRVWVVWVWGWRRVTSQWFVSFPVQPSLAFRQQNQNTEKSCNPLNVGHLRKKKLIFSSQPLLPKMEARFNTNKHQLVFKSLTVSNFHSFLHSLCSASFVFFLFWFWILLN